MELRKNKISQELRDAREDLLNINFGDSSYPCQRIHEWMNQWDTAFRKTLSLSLPGMLNIRSSVLTAINGYEGEVDTEVFNEIRPTLIEPINGFTPYCRSCKRPSGDWEMRQPGPWRNWPGDWEKALCPQTPWDTRPLPFLP